MHSKQSKNYFISANKKSTLLDSLFMFDLSVLDIDFILKITQFFNVYTTALCLDMLIRRSCSEIFKRIAMKYKK